LNTNDNCFPQVFYDDFNFRKYDKATLQKLEASCCFPPRFVVNYIRDEPKAQLRCKIILSTGEEEMCVQLDYDFDPIKGNITLNITI